MASKDWEAVDDYFEDLLISADPVLETALQDSDAAGLPPHHVTPNQGKLLHLLIQIQGARRVLEIGTLGGYSTIWLARALPTDGYLVTLESNPHHAEVARSNLARANLLDTVDLRVGNALNLLPGLQPPSILFLLMPISPTIPIIWTGHSGFLGQER